MGAPLPQSICAPPRVELSGPFLNFQPYRYTGPDYKIMDLSTFAGVNESI
jgi:hypothetical protein